MATATFDERRTTALRECVESMERASRLAVELLEMDRRGADTDSLAAYAAVLAIRKQLEKLAGVV